jgi:acetyl-CoA/propionyl-CoA carboxylase biotin carboxyl carrier protein
MFSKILIANRAEIAVRIIRTCRELGVGSVAIHSDADANAMHVRLADEAVALPGTSANETYLDIDKVIAAAIDTGAEAIHPGYGFLAENADFAQAVVAAGLAFIGPPGDAIAVMGEKVAARQVATDAGVPQVPGSKGAITTAEEVLAFGGEHGYPVAIKASYGGGGRGMRTVAGPEEAKDSLEAAQRESLAAFGRADVYLERYLDNARHVEVQIFADTQGNAVWLGDRDCSVQRRHQKLVEEAPAPGLSDDLRQAMGEASVRLAKAVDYVGAGTVEFLVEAERDAFYFLEMNTRIQVEHPVTELTLGLDLIAEQLSVASGEPLSMKDSGPAPRGHAIEIRVNAEDVTEGAFRPSPGPLTKLEIPNRTGLRFDSGYAAGDEVLPYYDSLIAKLVVWAPTRTHAIDRTLQVIDEIRLEGVPTTLPAAAVVLDHTDFRDARISTQWLETRLDLRALLPADAVLAAIPDVTGQDADDVDYDRQEVFVGGRRYLIPTPIATTSVVSSGSGSTKRKGRPQGRGAPAAGRGGGLSSGTLTSPMQGTIVKVNVEKGQEVALGDIVIVMEAMKMENPIRASVAGVVSSLSASEGQVIAAGTVLAEITPSES